MYIALLRKKVGVDGANSDGSFVGLREASIMGTGIHFLIFRHVGEHH
jgi:hypothetical protein